MDRRVEVLKALAGQNKYNAVKIKISILELLLKYGYLYFSDLKRCLEKEKDIALGIGTLHKYIKKMIDAGILKGEKASNKLFISIDDLSAVDWLFEGSISRKEDPNIINNTLYYIKVVKNYWNKLRIRTRNKEISLKEYAPMIILKLTASGLEPFKQITLLNRVAQQLGMETTMTPYQQIEVTLHDIEGKIEKELERIDPVVCKRYMKLLMDFTAADQLKGIVCKYFPSRGFTGPPLQRVKEALDSMRKEISNHPS